MTQPITLGRDICGDIESASQREWLITNGLGGYGCGTLSGVLTRCYHGLLIAALNPPVERTLLLTKLDETVQYLNTPYPLSCDRWSGGTTTGHGYRHIETFQLIGTRPTWTYACADARLTKTLWMQPGQNTTYCQYHLISASAPLTLSIKALVNHRDHHHTTQSTHKGKTWQIHSQSHPRGLKVSADGCPVPFYILSTKGQLQPVHKWYQQYFLSLEKARGLNALDDHHHAATLRTTLQPGDTLTVVASTDPYPNLDIEDALSGRVQHEQTRLEEAKHLPLEQPYVSNLVLAADQFVVDRPLPSTNSEGDGDAAKNSEGRSSAMPLPSPPPPPFSIGKTIIAGYPWFGDWGRDTMIALPGLTLATGRAEIARPILRTFALHISEGMIPNAFPEDGQTPGYNTVDATLWYVEALRAYLEVTDDLSLLDELFPILEDVIEWHLRGTRYNIHLDPKDGLIYAGVPGVQLTWMDAKVDNWVVTPRVGKPVEINALWHNALCCMAEFCNRISDTVEHKHSADEYRQLASTNAHSFQKFWNKQTGHLFDLLDGPEGNDPALRPNQLFAVSLHYAPPLSEAQCKAIVDTSAQQLLTTFGMRSLSPNHPDYIRFYTGNLVKRDGAYHQGTTWGWLIGPFLQAHLNVYNNPNHVKQYLTAYLQQLSGGGCIGSISEIFDGEAPFLPRGAYAQAWSISEPLRILSLLESHT